MSRAGMRGSEEPAENEGFEGAAVHLLIPVLLVELNLQPAEQAQSHVSSAGQKPQTRKHDSANARPSPPNVLAQPLPEHIDATRCGWVRAEGGQKSSNKLFCAVSQSTSSGSSGRPWNRGADETTGAAMSGAHVHKTRRARTSEIPAVQTNTVIAELFCCHCAGPNSCCYVAPGIEFRPQIGRPGRYIGQHLTNFGPNRAMLAVFCPTLANSDQTSTNLGQFWSKCGRIWPTSTFGQSSTHIGQFRSKLANNLANVDQHLANIEQHLANIGEFLSTTSTTWQYSAYIDQHRAQVVQCLSNLGRIGVPYRQLFGPPQPKQTTLRSRCWFEPPEPWRCAPISTKRPLSIPGDLCARAPSS